MKPLQVLSEIELTTRRLIEAGLSVQQNWPILRPSPNNVEEIGISGTPELSLSMKDHPYSEIYGQLSQANAFHLRLIDGTLVQLLYRFKNGKLVRHRLCSFPAPTLESYDTDPHPYEDDEIYADIVSKGIVHVPLRFDFDAEHHVDVSHPMSHLTLGQYLNCRIPVNAPLTPVKFLKFILRNFYFGAFQSHKLDSIASKLSLEETITKNERMISHLMC